MLQRTRTQLGQRSFHVAAPVVWNALPVYLHSRTIQSWVANPSLQPSLQHPLRTFCFKSVLYLLTTEREDMVSRPSPYNGVSMQYLVWTMLPPFLKVWCVPIPELWCIVSEL